MKVIIDTNLWISFLLHGEVSKQLIDILSRDDIVIVTSQLSLDELVTVASRKKFAKRISNKQISLLLGFILKESLFYPLSDIPQRRRDPKDDFLLELAVTSCADYLLTGDSDLLGIKKIGTCQITTVSSLYSQL